MSYGEVLLLNSNFEPLNVCNVRRAMALILVGKAEAIEHEGHIRTSEGHLPRPSIVKMRYHVRRPMPGLRLSRHSILARDGHACQYCGSSKELTIDHVLPRWLGGKASWDNLVACCRKCNLKKGHMTLQQSGMRLRRSPRRPRYTPYLSLTKYMRAIQRANWSMYLPVFEELTETLN